MNLIFVDVSKTDDFHLCAVEIKFENLSAARSAVRRFKKKRQKAIQFVRESDSRRTQMLEEYSIVDLNVKIFIAKGMSIGDSREKCLEALIHSLSPETYYSIDINRDERYLKSEKLLFIKSMDDPKYSNIHFYRFVKPKEETLLWIPDAIAWASSHGGPWLDSLEKFKVQSAIVT